MTGHRAQTDQSPRTYLAESLAFTLDGGKARSNLAEWTSRNWGGVQPSKSSLRAVNLRPEVWIQSERTTASIPSAARQIPLIS